MEVPESVRKDANLFVKMLANDLTDTESIIRRGVAYSPFVIWDVALDSSRTGRRPSAILMFARPTAPTAEAQSSAAVDGYLLLYDGSALFSDTGLQGAMRVPYKSVRNMRTLLQCRCC